MSTFGGGGGVGGGGDGGGGGGGGGADNEDAFAVTVSGGGGGRGGGDRDDVVLERRGGSEEKTREGLVTVKRLKRKKMEREKSAKAVILTKVGVLTTSLNAVAAAAFMMAFWTVCFSGKCGKVESKWTPEVMQEAVGLE